MSLTADPVAPPARAPIRRDGGRAALVSVASVLLGLAVWQLLAARFGPALLASPMQTLTAAVELAKDGTLFDSVLASARRIVIGWGLGLLVGVPVGLVMGRMRLVRTLLDPYIEFFRFIPPVAFVTLAWCVRHRGELEGRADLLHVRLHRHAEHRRRRARGQRVETARGRQPWCRALADPAPRGAAGDSAARGHRRPAGHGQQLPDHRVGGDRGGQVGLGALIWTSRNYGRIDWVFVGIITLGLLGFVFDRVLRIVARRLLGRYGVKL